MTKKITVGAMFLVLVLTFALVGCSRGPRTEAPAEFYKGKTITIIVPYSAGGGNDTQARIFAPYFQKYTGAGSVVIENMPGAGGLKGQNHVYGSVKPDGLTLGTFMGDEMILLQLLGMPGVGYDIPNISWIGRWFNEIEYVAISAKLPYTTPKDLATLKPLKLGATTATGAMARTAALFANTFDLNNTKIISGYTGTKEIALAIAQGEIHGYATELSVVDIFVREGTSKLFCAMSKEKSPRAPGNIPTIYELASQAGQPISGDKAKWLDLGDIGSEIRRALGGPPNIPQDKLEFLRDAFIKATQDKDWQAAWQKAGFPVDGPKRGDELQKAAAQIKMSESDISYFKSLVTQRFGS